MLILPQKVLITWCNSNRIHYESKGYIFTKIRDKFSVNVEDLSAGSNKLINVLCDYCGKEFQKKYLYYYKSRSIINNDCCKECQSLKAKESNLIIYGVENISSLPITREKVKQTNLIRYGAYYTAQVEECIEKKKNTLMERYGVEHQMQLDEVKNKIKQTNLDRYGVEYPPQNEEVKNKIKNTNLERYGVKYPAQNKEIQEKTRKTFYNNGTCPTSSQQLEIYNQLKNNNYIVELNYPISRCSLDIALFINNININIEYDAWKWHDPKKDRKRDEFLKSQGWKILRIKSGHKIPSLEQIQEGIFKLVNTDRTYTQIILDDWKDVNII